MSAIFGSGLFSKIIFADPTGDSDSIIDGTVWVDFCKTQTIWNNQATNINTWNKQTKQIADWDNLIPDQSNSIKCRKI